MDTSKNLKTIKTKKLTWIDIEKPNEKDVEYLRKNFNLHPKVLEEYLPPIKRAKVEVFEDHIFAILQFPLFKRKSGQISSGELDILITKDTLITSHQEVFPQLKKFFDDCSLHDQIRKEYMNQTPAHLLYYILDKIIDSRLLMLDGIAEKIDMIEEQVFKGKEKEMVEEISKTKRDIFNFREATKPQRTLFENLNKAMVEIFPQFNNLNFLTTEIMGSEREVWNTLENQKEMLEAIEETNNSLLSYKISDIVKILTIVSFITFPLGVVAGIFGMNVFHNVGFVYNPYTYLIIIGIMIIAAGIMVIIFKKKKWL